MTNNEIASLLMIILGIMITILIVLVCVYFFIRFKTKKKTTTDNSNTNINGKTKVQQIYNVQSIFNFMEFDKIEDNMIIQKNGKKYLMVVI